MFYFIFLVKYRNIQSLSLKTVTLIKICLRLKVQAFDTLWLFFGLHIKCRLCFRQFNLFGLKIFLLGFMFLNILWKFMFFNLNFSYLSIHAFNFLLGFCFKWNKLNREGMSKSDQILAYVILRKLNWNFQFFYPVGTLVKSTHVLCLNPIFLRYQFLK